MRQKIVIFAELIKLGNIMRKIVFLVMTMMAVTGCTCKKESKIPVWVKTSSGSMSCINTTDSTFRIMGMDNSGTDTGWIYVHPGDTFPDYHPWWYPDTIKVAFTRDGVFEDSAEIEAMRIPEDSDDGAYGFRTVVGDAFYYNLRGKFVRFYEAETPHSRDNHDYRP